MPTLHSTGRAAPRPLTGRPFAKPALCLILLCLAGGRLFAQPVVTLDKTNGTYLIGGSSEFFLDRDGRLGYEQVADPGRGPAFTASQSENLNFGYIADAVWVRFRVQNPDPSLSWMLRVDNLDDVRVYFQSPRGGVTEQRVGRKAPLTDVLRRYGYYYLNLSVGTQPMTVYIRFKHDDTLGIHLAVINLQSLLSVDTEDLFYGIYFGLIAVMVLYNLFLFLMLKDVSYLYYSLYITGMLTLTVVFMGIIYNIIPSGSAFSSDMLETIVLSLVLAAYIQFVRKYLIARTVLPRVDKALFVVALVALAHIPTIFFIPYQPRTLSLVIVFVTGLSLTVALVVACIRRKYSPVNFYISAIAAIVGGVIVFLLRNIGTLPNIFITEFSMQIGSSAEAVLLAFGLAFRINVLEKEKERAVAWGRSNLEKAERMEADYRMLFETAPLGIALFSLDGQYQAVNDSYCHMYERSREELTGRYLFTLVYPEPRESAERGYWNTLVAGPKTGIATFERTNVTRSGRRINVRYFLNFTKAANGAPAGVLCCVEDITDLKKALDDLRSSVREKELLLKEVHHRVKNNLQIIISLFRLKSREINDPACQEVLEATAARIRAIANVHNRIYLSPDVAQVEADTFIPSSVKQALSVFHLPEEQCTVVYLIEQAKLSVDIALPLSLIINELVTNSVRHGHNGRDAFTIEVRFKTQPARPEGTGFLLEIGDTGRGFPADYPTSRFESFGLNLVETLTAQLGGTLTLTTRPHTRLSIAFSGKDATT